MGETFFQVDNTDKGRAQLIQALETFDHRQSPWQDTLLQHA